MNTIADRVSATLCHSRHSHCFHLGGTSSRSSRLGINNRMPTTDAKDSCKPMLPMAKGFCASSTKSATVSAVQESYSRSRRLPRSKIPSITAARTTDGDAPVNRAKNTNSGSAKTLFHRLPPGRSSKNSTKNTKCIPDTAVMWLRPVRERSLRNRSERPDWSPAVSACRMPAASPLYKQSSCSTSQWDARVSHQRGLSRSVWHTWVSTTFLPRTKMPWAV